MPRSRSSSGVAVGHCAAAIRSAQQADLLEIVRLAADSLESPLSTDAVQAELDRGLATVLVAEQPQPSGGIVGALVGWRVAADVLEVHELMVHPAHRRQGIAGMLLLHFEDRCPSPPAPPAACPCGSAAACSRRPCMSGCSCQTSQSGPGGRRAAACTSEVQLDEVSPDTDPNLKHDPQPARRRGRGAVGGARGQLAGAGTVSAAGV